MLRVKYRYLRYRGVGRIPIHLRQMSCSKMVGRNGKWNESEREREKEREEGKGGDVGTCTVCRETTEVPYVAVRKPQHGRNEQ